MEHDTYWANTALFSPSKARQQQAQAKDWHYVDSWLTRMYAPKSAPVFERNEDTLQALLTLVAVNERADEEQELVHRLEGAAIEALKKADDCETARFYDALEAALYDDGRQGVEALSKAAVILDSPDVNIESLGHHAVELTTLRFELAQQLRRTEELQKSLESEQQRLTALLKEVKSETFAAPQDLPEKTAEWTRATKILRAKLAEYNDRLDAVDTASTPKPSVLDVATQQIEIRNLKQELRNLEEDIRAFHGLVPEVNAARAQVDEARTELRNLTLRRDRFFEGLVEGSRR